jgi:hypothetical protein
MGHGIICRWSRLGFGVCIFQSNNWSYWGWSRLVVLNFYYSPPPPPLLPSLYRLSDLVRGIWLILYWQWFRNFSYILVFILWLVMQSTRHEAQITPPHDLVVGWLRAGPLLCFLLVCNFVFCFFQTGCIVVILAAH